jgi:hypothetical protein
VETARVDDGTTVRLDRLRPGQSLFDHEFPERSRMVHSVRALRSGDEPTDEEADCWPRNATHIVFWGSPDQKEEPAERTAITKSKEFHLVADVVS